jgi:hypothetical protein
MYVSELPFAPAAAAAAATLKILMPSTNILPHTIA